MPPELLPHQELELTLPQYVFCLAWLENGGNGTKAYQKAHPGASDAVAATEAWRDLRKPKVVEALRRLWKDYWGPFESGAEESVGRIGAMARAATYLPLLYDEKGALKPVAEWPRAVLVAVKEYDRDKGVVKLVDPLAANNKVLELTGRLKNPLAGAADILVEALSRDLAKHGEAK